MSAPSKPATPVEEDAKMETSDSTPAPVKAKYTKPKALVSKVADVKPDEKKKSGRGRPKGSPNKNKAKDSEPPKEDEEEADKKEEEEKPFIKPTLMKAAPKPVAAKPAISAAPVSGVKKPVVLAKKIVAPNGGNKFAVKSDAVSAMGSKLLGTDKPKQVISSPLKKADPGKISPLQASMNLINKPVEDSGLKKKIGFSFTKKIKK